MELLSIEFLRILREFTIKRPLRQLCREGLIVFFQKNHLELCDISVILALVLLDQDKRTEQHQG